MRKSLFFVLCCLAVACQRQEQQTANGKRRVVTTNTPADARNARIDEVVHPIQFIDRAVIGNKVEADGTVKDEVTAFKAGEPVYFTMFLHESPVGLKTQAVWFDASDKEIHREERDMNGAKVVTFTLDSKKLKPGKYHVKGLWGGNLGDEKDFTIEAAGKAKGKK